MSSVRILYLLSTSKSLRSPASLDPGGDGGLPGVGLRRREDDERLNLCRRR